MCKDLVTSNLTFEVSIGNANQAVIALRTYGLTESEAIDLIAKETDIAINDYHIIPENAISPELIEIFGAQYVADCLPYVYHFMKVLKIDWNLYKVVLTMLLDVFHLEDIAAFPERIRFFLNKLENKARILQRADCGKLSVKDDEPANPEYVYRILETLKSADISAIISMCNDPVYEDYEEESYE